MCGLLTTTSSTEPHSIACFLGEHKDPAMRRQFWSELDARGDPRLREHPMTAIKDWQDLFVPFALHGDGIPVLQVGKPTQHLWMSVLVRVYFVVKVHHCFPNFCYTWFLG